ncbi:hypothetical protein GEMRC1_003129 [Eukaryota sp. GEM-RC1]
MPPKEVALFYFRKMNPQADEVPDGKVGYKCRFCPERDPVFIKPGTGYSNLLPHIHKVHPQYREEMNLGHIDRFQKNSTETFEAKCHEVVINHPVAETIFSIHRTRCIFLF